MIGVKKIWVGPAGLFLSLIVFQAGCQQAAPPPGEESAGGGTVQPTPGASSDAPSGRSAAATPRATEPPAAEPPAPPRSVTLAAGTSLKVRTTSTISTKSHQAGDSFAASLEEPLTQGGITIAPKGAAIQGKILESDPGGRVSGLAHITVALDSVQTGEGQTVSLATKPVRIEAQRSRGEDAAKIGIATGIGAAVGAIAGGGKGAGIGAATGAGAGTGVVLATRGDAAEIGSETILDFQLSSPLTITEARE